MACSKITDKNSEYIALNAWHLKLLAPVFIAYKSHWLQGVDELIVDFPALL